MHNTRKRLISNPALHLVHGDTYKGRPLLRGKGPFIAQYLEQTCKVIDQAQAAYPRVFALRFDLRFSRSIVLPQEAYTNASIERFFASLKAKIKYNRERAEAQGKRVHDTVVRYVWVREYGKHNNLHYHCCILLNKDAFFSPGKFNSSSENMHGRLQSAWESALGLSSGQGIGLVCIPKNASYYLSSDRSSDDLFHRLSYFCKTDYKRYGDGQHGFGCSRR